MSTSPTPEEQKKKDEEARAREAEEQAKLPYKWTQTIGDVDVTVPVDGKLKGKDLVVVLKKTKLTVGVKGQPPIIDVSRHPTPLSQALNSNSGADHTLLLPSGRPPQRNQNRRIHLDARNDAHQ